MELRVRPRRQQACEQMKGVGVAWEDKVKLKREFSEKKKPQLIACLYFDLQFSHGYCSGSDL